MTAARFIALACAASAVAGAAMAQPDASGSAGSAAFCLFPVPTEDSARQRWVNLGIVQYVETSQNELRIVFGGGNFGAGHEIRIACSGPEEVRTQLDRMRQAATACAAH
jgi:hypothetical protein